MGAYPATPDERVPYHRNGATGFYIDASNNVTQLTGPQLATLNDESDSAVSGLGDYKAIGIILPYTIDLTKYFAAHFVSGARQARGPIDTSVDTTNGRDGNWLTAVTPFVGSDLVRPFYRSAIQTASATGIKAVRFNFTSWSGTIADETWLAIHLYGAPSSGQHPYLRMWHPTLDQALAVDAFYQGANQGDVAQSGSYDVTFRIKNLNATQTANGVVVQTEGRAGSTEHAGWVTISQGGAFAASQNIGNLAAGAISGVLTARIAPPSNASLNLGSPSVGAVPTSWT